MVREVGFDGREREYVYNLRGDLIQQHEMFQGVRQTLNLHYDPMGRMIARELPATQVTPKSGVRKSGVRVKITGGEHQMGWLTYGSGHLLALRMGKLELSLELDALHRLSYVERKQVGQPRLRVYYIYDALSRRIAKQVIPDRSPAQLTRYGWDGDQLVHEDDGDQRITLFYEPGTFVPLFRVDELGVNALEAQGISVEQLIQENIDTSRYSAFITDHLGTPTKLIDEDGHLLWSGQADDWAAVKHERSVPNLKQPVRFQGQWLDEETGLYYNRYRYYDPKQGRYITQDPIGLAGGLNSYAYVTNPTGWVDPLGLEQTLPCDPNESLQCASDILKKSEFCEVMCHVASYENNFDSPKDFARSIRDVDIRNTEPGELNYLPTHPNHHYETGLGPVYDMQYVMTGWALDTQVRGSANIYYAGYSVLGRGLGNLMNGRGFNTNFFDNANGSGLQFGIWGAKQYSSFMDFANGTCHCD